VRLAPPLPACDRVRGELDLRAERKRNEASRVRGRFRQAQTRGDAPSPRNRCGECSPGFLRSAALRSESDPGSSPGSSPGQALSPRAVACGERYRAEFSISSEPILHSIGSTLAAVAARPERRMCICEGPHLGAAPCRRDEPSRLSCPQIATRVPMSSRLTVSSASSCLSTSSERLVELSSVRRVGDATEATQ
jgi:hypothetical protein